MIVTAVRLSLKIVKRANNPGNQLLAIGSVELDNELCVSYIKLVQLRDGRVIISMPSILDSAGRHRDTAYPKTAEARAKIELAVFAEYERQRRDLPGD